MIPCRRRFLQCAGGALALAAIPGSHAQAYPARSIRLVIPFPPGGAFDAVGRPFAERIKPLLGPMAVENVGGGGASIGAAAVAHARPDGYTILLGGTLPHVNEALLKKQPLYDPVRDLEPVAGIAANYLCIAVHPSVPARDLRELVTYAREHPGKLSYGHAGVGSIQHLAGELFKSVAATPDVLPVPYRGTGPVVADLVAGQIPMGTPGVTGQVLEFHRAGRLRILAVTSTARLAAAPDLPTAVEQGFPGLVVKGSIGLLAPAGTPVAIIGQLAQATRAVVADRGFQQLLTDAGIEPLPDSNPEEFKRSLASDVAFWSPIVKSLAIKLE